MSLSSTLYGSVTSGPEADPISGGWSSITQSGTYSKPAAARGSEGAKVLVRPGAWHGAVDVPVLDVDDRPDDDARAVGQPQRGPVDGGGIDEPLTRPHAPSCRLRCTSILRRAALRCEGRTLTPALSRFAGEGA